MPVRLRPLVVCCLCCLIAGSSVSWAQESHLDAPGEIPKYVRDPIPLYTTGLGPFHRPISSKNKEAQAFFDQGFQMEYAFARLDAMRSFREAWKRDPDCAICYWGEGWAWGSYLNGPMSAEQSPFAYAATQKAISLRDKASPKERAFIDALAVRYVKDFDAEDAQGAGPGLRRRDGQGRGAVSRRSRRDHAVRRRALHPRAAPRHARRQRAEHQAPARRARIRAGKIDPKHPGACHLYVHATESTVKPRARRGVRPVPRQDHSRREPHQSHAVAHVERSRPMGRFGARQSRSVALGPEGRRRRRLRDLSRSQPAHAALRRVDGRTERHRDAGRQGLHQAHQRHDVSGADARSASAASTKSSR